jgi:hypothetical protein
MLTSPAPRSPPWPSRAGIGTRAHRFPKPVLRKPWQEMAGLGSVPKLNVSHCVLVPQSDPELGQGVPPASDWSCR